MPNTVQEISPLGGQAEDATPRFETPRLAGRRAWIISDGVAGHAAITQGVAETLGLDAEVKPIAPGFPWRHLAPNGPADPSVLKQLLRDDPPEIVLGAGRQTVPFVRALKRQGAFAVLFQSPRATTKSADVIWVPAHDVLRGPNVITTLTPPHRFTPQRLAALRDQMPDEIAALPQPRFALLIGGPGAGYRYDQQTIDTFAAAIARAAARAGSVLITPSRRTPKALLAAVDEATHDTPRILWTGEGDNPYPHFLSCADGFIVSADSVNMTGEACATGRPVHVFHPPGGRTKFHRFHQALQEHGATRPLAPDVDQARCWSYEPLNAAEIVAGEIEARWRVRSSTAGDASR